MRVYQRHGVPTLDDLELEHLAKIVGLLENSYDKASLRLSCKSWKRAVDVTLTYVPNSACKFCRFFHFCSAKVQQIDDLKSCDNSNCMDVPSWSHSSNSVFQSECWLACRGGGLHSGGPTAPATSGTSQTQPPDLP